MIIPHLILHSAVHNFIIILSRVYNELIQRDLLPVGSLAYKPEPFSGFLFATAKVAFFTAMITPHLIPFYYTLYSLSVVSLAKSLQLILEISATYR